MTEDRCGTYAGAQTHRRRGEPVCDACRAANAAYMRRWRERRPDLHAENMATHEARNRALRRLAQLYPQDLRRLYLEEMSAGRVRQGRAS